MFLNIFREHISNPIFQHCEKEDFFTEMKLLSTLLCLLETLLNMFCLNSRLHKALTVKLNREKNDVYLDDLLVIFEF